MSAFKAIPVGGGCSSLITRVSDFRIITSISDHQLRKLFFGLLLNSTFPICRLRTSSTSFIRFETVACCLRWRYGGARIPPTLYFRAIFFSPWKLIFLQGWTLEANYFTNMSAWSQKTLCSCLLYSSSLSDEAGIHALCSWDDCGHERTQSILRQPYTLNQNGAITNWIPIIFKPPWMIVLSILSSFLLKAVESWRSSECR